MSDDILVLLRDWRSVHLARLHLVMDEAADEIGRLRLAIRRLADQDATLSVCDGAVTVTMDAALTDAEREAVEWAAFELDGVRPDNGRAAERAATLRGLLERTKAEHARSSASPERTLT
jgi:hypothetical protein